MKLKIFTVYKEMKHQEMLKVFWALFQYLSFKARTKVYSIRMIRTVLDVIHVVVVKLHAAVLRRYNKIH